MVWLEHCKTHTTYTTQHTVIDTCAHSQTTYLPTVPEFPGLSRKLTFCPAVPETIKIVQESIHVV